MNLTKVRYSDLAESLQLLLDELATHKHDGSSGNGTERIDWNDITNIPVEITANPATLIVGETPTGVVDGVNTVFVLANAVLDNNKEAVYVHGKRKAPTDDYTLVTTTLTFVEAPPSGSNILVDYQPVI